MHANALRATTEQRGCDVGDAGVKPDDLRLQLMISHMSFEGYWEEWDSLKLMRPTPDAEKVTTDPQSLFAVSEPEDAQQQLQDHPLLLELSYLESLVSQLSQARSVSEKVTHTLELIEHTLRTQTARAPGSETFQRMLTWPLLHPPSTCAAARPSAQQPQGSRLFPAAQQQGCGDGPAAAVS